ANGTSPTAAAATLRPCSSRISTPRAAAPHSTAHLTPTLSLNAAPHSTADGTSQTTMRVACGSMRRSSRRLRGRVRARDETVHVAFAETVLLEPADGLAAG